MPSRRHQFFHTLKLSELWVQKSIRLENRFWELWFLRSQERGSAPSVSLWHGELFSALVSESYHCLNSSEEIALYLR